MTNTLPINKIFSDWTSDAFEKYYKNATNTTQFKILGLKNTEINFKHLHKITLDNLHQKQCKTEWGLDLKQKIGGIEMKTNY